MAHRGFSAVEAENTVPAFEAALAAGADGVELDVRLTADGAPVVLHDPIVDRTTDGHGLVRDLTLAEVKSLRIATRHGGAAEVPTLAEVLRVLSGRALVDLEIKNLPGEPDFDSTQERVVEASIAALREAAFEGPVLASSFNPASLARCRALAPDLATGLLTIEEVEAHAALSFAASEGHPWVLPALASVTRAGEAFVRAAHDAGVRVGTWVVDEAETATRLARWGVDAIATNDPSIVVPAVRGAG